MAYVVGYSTEDIETFLSGYRSLDGGETWKPWYTVGTFQYRVLSFAPNDPDSAQSWQLGGVLPTGQILELSCDANDADRFYVDAGKDGLWRSDDAGLTWHFLTSGPVDPPVSAEVDLSDRFPLPQRLAVHPHLGGALYLAAGNVYRSLDAGDTRTQVYEGEPPFCQLSLPADGSSVLARPCALDQPVADRQYGLWRSDDGGSSWQQLRSDPLGPRMFTDPVDAERATATGYLKPLLESFDGQRWYLRGQGLPAQRLRALAVHPLEPQVRLAAAADQLLRSDDDGASYTQVDDPDLDGRELHDVRYAPGLTAAPCLAASPSWWSMPQANSTPAPQTKAFTP